MRSTETIYFDFLIIGGGPAGMAAAIQAARLGLSTTIIERDRLGGQALAAPWIENYPGFPDGISGKDLMKLFEAQLNTWSVPVIYNEVLDIEIIPPYPPLQKGGVGGFRVNNIETRCLLLAVGLTPKLVGIRGEIPYGDPARLEHADKDVLVVGSGDSAFDLASCFAEKARKVTIGMRDETPKALPKLVERALFRGVQIQANWSHKESSYDVLISCVGKEARHPLIDKLSKDLGPLELRPGEVTDIPGLFLAGDLCRGQDRHIVIAAGDGIAAAQAAHRYLSPPQRHREHREKK